VAHVLLTHLNAQSNLAEEAVESAERMVARGVQGVFFLPHGTSGEGGPLNRQVVDLFTKANVPVVLLDRDICEFPQRSAYDLVGVDNIRGGYLLGQHLIDVGCRRTMFFSENVSFSRLAPAGAGTARQWKRAASSRAASAAIPNPRPRVLEAVRQHKPDGIRLRQRPACRRSSCGTC
jgi:DNA-binding LacI/PurR family transcriptional regulator